MSRARPAPLWLPLLLVVLATGVLGGFNVASARAMAPSWGQDLAFFHQIVHSAANGGPWASPLLFEPQGFFEMVHSHLVLPLVVAVYSVVPRQEVVLLFQGLFAGLTMWPAFRLAEAVALERDHPRPALPAAIAALSLLLFGPYLAVGSCDFRPSVLFLPGVLGVFAEARRGRTLAALGWALVANLGRQEAGYLLAAAGLVLCVLPWGPAIGAGLRGRLAAVRWRTGLAVLAFAAVGFGIWVMVKPQMFFHFDPTAPPPAAVLAPEHVADRQDFALRVGLSLLPPALLAPTALLGGLPLFAQLARDGREWTDLIGATAHYHAPWMAFVAASALAGAMRWPRRLGGPIVGALWLCVAAALAFPWPVPRQGPMELRALTDAVPPDARVAADYDTIHAVAGRPVLWNSAQLLLPDDERPLAWDRAWPLQLSDVDRIIVDDDTELATTAQAAGWKVQARVAFDGREKLLLAAP